MKLTKMICAFSFMLAAAINTQAQTSTTQPGRIKQGVKSGELTKHETKTLVKQQRATRKDVRAAKADGVVTADERSEIKQDKKQTSKSIYRKKHNVRDRN